MTRFCSHPHIYIFNSLVPAFSLLNCDTCESFFFLFLFSYCFSLSLLSSTEIKRSHKFDDDDDNDDCELKDLIGFELDIRIQYVLFFYTFFYYYSTTDRLDPSIIAIWHTKLNSFWAFILSAFSSSRHRSIRKEESGRNPRRE